MTNTIAMRMIHSVMKTTTRAASKSRSSNLLVIFISETSWKKGPRKALMINMAECSQKEAKNSVTISVSVTPNSIEPLSISWTKLSQPSPAKHIAVTIECVI